METDLNIILARDCDRDRLRRQLLKHEIDRVRRGAYTVVDDDAPADRTSGRENRSPWAVQREVALLRLHAVAAQLSEPVFSRESAALLWGWPLWRVPLTTHITREHRRAGTAAIDVTRHFAPLPYDDVVEHDGLLVTTPYRTLIDICRHSHPLAALVVADAMLDTGADREMALRRLNALGRVPGSRLARWVLTNADAGAESPGESWLRYIVLRAGLPTPVTQWEVRTRLGTFRVDLAWPRHGVLGEFDGRIKYQNGAFGPGHDGADAWFNEKRRGDAIAEVAGAYPVRVTAKDSPESTVNRLLAAFPAATRATFRRNPLLPHPRLADG